MKKSSDMNTYTIHAAQKIGSMYAVAASVSGILFMIVFAEILGVLLVRYDPVQLLKDLLYLFNDALYAGVIAALLLSYFAGRSAGIQILTQSVDGLKVGVTLGTTVLALSMATAALVTGIKTLASPAQTSPIDLISLTIMNFVLLFVFGYLPTFLAGLLYGKILNVIAVHRHLSIENQS